MIRKLHIFLFWFLLVGITGRLTAIDSLKVHEYRLSNGLTVILTEMHHSPIISFLLFYKVGSRNETPGKTGLSHVTEHMMFRGTKRFNSGEIATLLRRNYSVFNAYTTRDFTLYYEKMPRNTIETAFEIESDRMQNCQFDPEIFRHELEVVKEERKIRVESNPQRLLEEQIYARLYGKHPYSWPITGWPRDLENLTAEDARSFYRKYYRPNNAVIVLAGDFNYQQMLQKIKQYFGSIPAGEPVPEPPDTFQFPASTRPIVQYSSRITHTKLLMYFPGVSYRSPDYPALRIGLYLLGNTVKSPLYQHLIKNQVCQKFHLSLSSQIDPAPIVFQATLKKGISPDTVRSIFFRAVRLLQEGQISPRELRAVKNRFLVNRAYRNLRIFDVATRLGTNMIRTGDYQYDRLVREKILNLTLQDIQKALKTYLQETAMVQGLLIPGRDSLPARDTAYVHMAPAGDMTPDISLPLPDKPVSYDSSRFVLLPALTEHVQTFTLANGIPVIFYPDHTVPIVELRGVIQTGNTHADGFTKGTGSLTCNLLEKGSQKFPPDILQDTLSSLASKVQFNSSEENIMFSWGTIREHFPLLTEIGSNLLLHPLFPESLFTSLQEEKIARLESIKHTTGWRISQYLMATIFRGHPYSYLPTPPKIRTITLEDIQRFYRRYCRPQHTTLIITGDIDKHQLQQLLNRYFGSWRCPESQGLSPFPQQMPVDSFRLVLFPAPDDRQVTLLIAHEAPDKHSPDLEKLMVANYILGGNSLTSRLGRTIRGEYGLVYGITSKLFTRNHGGWWMIKSKTSPENAAKVLLLTLNEIQRLKQEGVTCSEVNEAKGYFRGTMPFSIETPLDVLRIFVDQVKSGFPLNHWDRFPERLDPITVEDVNAAIRTYFHPERSIIAIGGPITREALQSELKQAIVETGLSLPFEIDFNRVFVREVGE